jgi:ComF family protein
MKGQGGVRNLLHRIKYQGQPETGRMAGRAYGKLLAAMPFSEDWDALVPVPMSMSKQRKRGYNQAVCIAEGLAKALEKPIVMDLLERREEGKSQTQKNRFDRWEAVQSLYTAGSGLTQYEGKHLVLVDDVITTGATVEACARVLKEAGFRVSVIALATVD